MQKNVKLQQLSMDHPQGTWIFLRGSGVGWRVGVRKSCSAQLPGSPLASSLQGPIGGTERSVANDPPYRSVFPGAPAR